MADTSVAAQTDLVVALMRSWGLEAAQIVAHDIGGAVGLRLTVGRPDLVERLALIDTVSYDSWPSETWRKIIKNEFGSYPTMSSEEFQALLTRQLQLTVSNKEKMTGETLTAYLGAASGEIGKASFFEHQVRYYDHRYTQEITDHLSDIEIPVLILWGQDDQWQSTSYAERLHADIPGSRLELISDAGHFVMEDSPEQVTTALLGFLKTD